MTALASLQSAMLCALYTGPDALPEGLFAATPRRVALGMSVHANTVAHARVSALADSAPHLLQHVGQPAFEAMARPYVDEPVARCAPLIEIGHGFADWLASRGEGAALVELARIDAAALSCLHAADVVPLGLTDLPNEADALLAMQLKLHTAARLLPYRDAAATFVDHPQLGSGGIADAVLIVRSGFAVTIFRIGADVAAIARRAAHGASIADLLAATDPPAEPALIAMIAADALMPTT